MKLHSFVTVARALDQAGVRYLVAGGLAVNAHGYLRYTNDIDLIVQLVPENILKAFEALSSIGYQPLVPITASRFADAEKRNSWIRDKNMTVLQFWSDAHRETPIDVRFVSIATLIDMKTAVGRQQDLIDVEHLKMRMEGNERD